MKTFRTTKEGIRIPNHKLKWMKPLPADSSDEFFFPKKKKGKKNKRTFNLSVSYNLFIQPDALSDDAGFVSNPPIIEVETSEEGGSDEG